MNVKHWVIVILGFAVVLAGGAEPESFVPGYHDPVPAMQEKEVLPADDEDSYFGGISLTVGGMGRADVKKSEAAYSVGGIELDVGLGPIGGSYKVLSYSWKNPGKFAENTGERDPWKKLHEASATLVWGGEVNDTFFYSLLGGISAGYEDEMDDSFAYTAGGFGIYKLTPRWMISAGGIYSKHQKIRSDLDFIPVAGVSWNAETTNGLSFSLGVPSTDLTWHFSKDTSLTLDMSSFEGGVYRLADNSPVREKGYVEFLNTNLSLRLSTLVMDRVGVGLTAGYALDRKFKLYDRDGKNSKSYEVQTKPGFMLSIAVPF